MNINKIIKVIICILAYLIPVFALFIPHSHFDVNGNEVESRAVSETAQETLSSESQIEITDQYHSWGTLTVITKTNTEDFYYTVFEKCGFLDLYYTTGSRPIDGGEIEARGDEIISVFTADENGILTRVRITPNTRYVYRIICHLIIITGLIFASTKVKKEKRQELEFEERRKNTKSFAEMAREEKEAKEREQNKHTE